MLQLEEFWGCGDIGTSDVMTWPGFLASLNNGDDGFFGRCENEVI